MKKMIILVVAMMSMTVASAKSNNTTAVKAVTVERNFDMSFDVRRLAEKLDLNDEQMEAVQRISNNFNREMNEAAASKGFKREVMIEKAVGKNVKSMRYVLDKDQFRTYTMLLGTTLRNNRIR